MLRELTSMFVARPFVASRLRRAVVAGALCLALAGCATVRDTLDELGGPDRDPSGQITEGGRLDWSFLQAGDCVDMTGLWGRDGDVFDVPGTRCDETHDSEVVAVLQSELTSYDQQSLDDEAAGRCWPATGDYVGPGWRLFAPALLHRWVRPARDSWLQGNRNIICFVGTVDEQPTLDRSLRGIAPTPPQPGVCLNAWAAVPCSQLHDGELTAVIESGLPSYDDQALAAEADQRCPSAADEYVGPCWDTHTTDLGYAYWTVPGDGWLSGDRAILCAIRTMDEEPTLTGSLQGVAA